jgi:hypothetical protein
VLGVVVVDDVVDVVVAIAVDAEVDVIKLSLSSVMHRRYKLECFHSQ